MSSKNGIVKAVLFATVVSVLGSSMSAMIQPILAKYDAMQIVSMLKQSGLSSKWVMAIGWLLFYFLYFVDDWVDTEKEEPFAMTVLTTIGWFFFLLQAITVCSWQISAVFGLCGLASVSVALLVDVRGGNNRAKAIWWLIENGIWSISVFLVGWRRFPSVYLFVAMVVLLISKVLHHLVNKRIRDE